MQGSYEGGRTPNQSELGGGKHTRDGKESSHLEGGARRGGLRHQTGGRMQQPQRRAQVHLRWMSKRNTHHWRRTMKLRPAGTPYNSASGSNHQSSSGSGSSGNAIHNKQSAAPYMPGTGSHAHAAAAANAHDGGLRMLRQAPVWAIMQASLGVFLFGFHLAVLNALLTRISDSLGTLSLAQQGSVVSTALLGAAAGSLAGGWVADLLGRIRAFALSGLALLFGGCLCASCTTLPTLLSGRLLCGIGLGVASSSVPVYMSEVAPPGIRGAVGSVNQLGVNLGIVAALVIGALTCSTTEGWRFAFWLSCGPAVLFALSPLLLHEPQQQQPYTQQQQQQHCLHHSIGDGVEQHKEQLGVPDEHNQQSSWSDLLHGWPERLTVGVSVFCLQQLAGVNAIIFFSSSFFAAAGLSNATMASALIGFCNILGTCVSASLMDSIGRKPLLAGSFAGMCLCMCALALFPNHAALSLSFTLLYILSFACGAGPIPPVVVAEIFPADLRGKASSLALGMHWIANAVVGQAFLPAVSRYGFSSVFATFAAFAALATVLVVTRVPETMERKRLAPTAVESNV